MTEVIDASAQEVLLSGSPAVKMNIGGNGAGGFLSFDPCVTTYEKVETTCDYCRTVTTDDTKQCHNCGAPI